MSKKTGTGQPDADAAREALLEVKTAYANKIDVRILDVKGMDSTKEYFASDKPSQEASLEPKDSYDVKDNLVGVARTATDLSSYEKPSEGNPVRHAILLSEDRKTRLRATKEKVAALAPSVLRRILEWTPNTARARSSTGGATTPQDLSPLEGSKTPLEIPGDRMDME